MVCRRKKKKKKGVKKKKRRSGLTYQKTRTSAEWTGRPIRANVGRVGKASYDPQKGDEADMKRKVREKEWHELRLHIGERRLPKNLETWGGKKSSERDGGGGKVHLETNEGKGRRIRRGGFFTITFGHEKERGDKTKCRNKMVWREGNTSVGESQAGGCSLAKVQK